ncbi:MAG: hypothetical protein U0941_30260 [Planctomycetaceae bacterium]
MTVASLSQVAGTGTTTLNGAVSTNTAQGVQLTGTNLAVNAGISTTANGVVTVNESGTVVIAAVGDIAADGAVSLTAGGGIATAGDITTTNDSVTFASATTLTGSVSIDTGAGTGDIAFQSTLTGTNDGVEDLTLTAGTGNITFTGAVGATRLGDVLINSAADVTESAGMTVASLKQVAGTGTTTLDGAVDTNTAQGVQLTGTNLVVNAGITTTADGVVTVNESGTVVIAAAGDITADGAVSLTAGGGIATAGDITTTNDNVTFASATTLTGAVNIDTGAGAGDITFQNTLTGTTDGVEDLALTAGAGNVTFTGAVGATRLGAIVINSAADVTESAGITSASLVQIAGTGTTTLDGVVDTNTVVGVHLTGTNLNVNADITTTNGGVVTLTESGTIQIASTGDISADAAVTLTATGGISTAGDITTTNDNVTFASATNLTGPVSIDTGAGIGNIVFQSTVDGAQALSLTAGAGNISFADTVGSVSPLQSLTINSAVNVTFQATVSTVNDLTQVTGTGTTTFSGTSGIGIGGQLSVTTRAIVLNSSTFTTVGAVLLSADDAITLNAGLDAGNSTITINANTTGADAAGFTQTAGIIQTTNSSANSVLVTVGGTGDAAIRDIRSNTMSGIVTVTVAGGNISDNLAGEGANVTAAGLALTSLTGIGTSGTGNINTAVSNLEATTSIGGIFVSNTGSLTVGGVTGVMSGLSVTGAPGQIELISDNTITVNEGIAASNDITLVGGGQIQLNAAVSTTDAVRISTSGGVSQTASGTVTASEFGVRNSGTGNVVLDQGNLVTTFAASNSANGGTIQFTNASSLTVGTISSDGSLFASTDGITSNTGNVTIITSGTMTIGTGAGQSISATGATVTLNAITGGIAESAGSIVNADKLLLQGAGTFSLVESNTVGTLAAGILGSLDYNDADDLSIGTVGATNGITTGDGLTAGGSVTINAAGNLTVDQAISTATGTGGFISVTNATLNAALTAGAGNITLTGGGQDLIINVDQTSNTTITYSATRDIIIHATITANGGTSDLVLTADSDGNHVGGVWVDESGLTDAQLVAGHDITLHGSDVFATNGSFDSVRIDSDGASLQLQAGNSINLLANGAAPANADIVVEGVVTATTGSITIDSAHLIQLAADQNAGLQILLQDAVQLTGDVTQNSHDVTFASTIDGAFNLVVNASGTTTFEGAIGSGNALTSLTTDANGITDLNGGTITVGTADFQDDIVLTENTVVNATSVTFAKSVNGDATANDRTLLINATTTTFDGVIGDTGILANLTTDSTGTTFLNGGVINATIVDFQDNVVLGATTTINGVDVSFDGNLNALNAGVQGLTVNASGTTTFGDAAADTVGTTQLQFLTTDAAGTTQINAANIATTGNQTYHDGLILGNSTTLTGTNVTFNGTIDAVASGVQGLTVNAATTTFNGLVGNANRLSTLTTDASGVTVINTSSIKTTSDQIFNDAVQLDLNTTLDSSANGSITFNSTLDSVTGETNSLLVNTSGTTTFNDLVGSTDRLSTLTTDAGGSTVINTSSVTTVTDQTFNDAVKLDTNTTLDSLSSGNVTFNSTLDSASGETNSLVVNTSGTTTFNDLVGNTDRLSTLTTDAGGTTVINTSTIKTASDQTYNDAVKLDSNTTLDSNASGNVTFNSTLDSVTGETNSLLVTTSGTTSFNGLVGNSDRLSTLTTDAGGSTVINTSSVKTVTDQTYNDAVKLDTNTTLNSNSSGNVTFNSTLNSVTGETNLLLVTTSGTTTFNGLVGNADRLSTLTTDAGGSTVVNTSSIKSVSDQTYNDSLKLDTNTTLDSNNSGNVTFNGILDSVTGETNSLLVNTSGTTAFNGMVGNSHRLSTLTTDAGGSTVINTSSIKTVTDQSYNDAVLVDTNSTLDSNTSGNVTFNSTVDSTTGETNSLLVNTSGTTTFNGLVGSTDRLSTLTTDAGGSTVINTSNINTVTDQTYNDAVLVDANTTLDSSTNGNVTFNSTVDSTTGETNSLLVNTSGTTTFNGLVGNADRLSTLTTNAGGSTVINTSSIKTVSDQTFNDVVLVDTNTTLDSSTSGNITFNSTVDSATGETNSLLVNTSGTTTFNDLVGNTDRLLTLTTDAGGSTVINTSTIKTASDQTYNDAVTLDTNTTLDSSSNGNVNFNSTLDSVSGETNSLLVNTAGTTTFNGLVGSTDRLSTLTTDAGGSTVINTSTINTVTDQTYNDAVLVDANTTLDTSAGGNVTFNSTLDSASGETNSLSVNTSGTTTFNGQVGSADRLSTLTTDVGGTTVINTSTINTTSDQTYNDAVKLDTNTTLDSSSNGNVTFNSTLDSVVGETNSLLVNTSGATTFNGLVGNTDRLSTLTTDAGGSTVVDTSSVNTVTDQTYNDAVKLDTNTTLDSSSNGNVTFNSTLDSVSGETNSLLVNTSGTTTFNGLVGNADRLSTLTTDAGGSTVINTSTVNTVTDQTYNDAVLVDANTTLDSSTSGNITFNSTLDSVTGETNSLVVNTSGTTTFNSLVGSSDRLLTLTTDSGGSTVINTSSIKTLSDQTYNDAVILETSTTLDSSTSGNVTFNSTLDSASAETNSLLINTSGTTTFNGAVGSTDRLSTLTTDAGGFTVINTSSIRTVTDQTYNDAVKVDTNTTLDSSTNGNVTFNSTVDSTAGETNSLLVNTSGTTTFNGLVGNTDRLSTLTTDAGGLTVINTSSIKTTTDQTYNDAVKLDTNITLDSSASGNITFNSTLDSVTGELNSLLVNTSGTTTFNGLVGNTDRLSTLTTNAGGTTVINTSSIKTASDQTINDAVKLDTNTTLDSNSNGNVTFNSTLDSAAGETNSLLVNTSGTTTFNGLVGNTDRLSTLTTNAGGSTVINTSSIKTVTDQTYNDAVKLDTNTTLDSSTNGNVTFNSSLDSVTGETNSLLVNTSGTTTFNGLVGTNDRLSTLTTDAGGSTIINTTSVETVSDQTYNDAVKLDTNTTLDSSGSGNITFNSTLDSVTGETNSLLVNTTGTTTFNDLVGNTDRLSTLTTNAGGSTVINTSSVKTVTDQSYNDAVKLDTNTTLDSNSNGNITFNSTLDSVTGETNSLLLNTSGTTTFNGLVGSSERLSTLTTDAGGSTVINTASITTVSDQTYNDAVKLDANTTLDSNASGNVTFNSTLDSVTSETNSLLVNTAGTTTFNGLVGNTDRLSTLTTDAGGTTVINTSSVKTVSDQTYNDAVTLDTNTTLDSSASGNVTFNSTLDSASGETNSLLVNTSGTTTFNGLVGGTDRLSTLTTNAGGSTVINTSSVNTVSDQTYNDAVKLDTNTTLDSSTSGNITFNNTLDSVTGETNSLLVNTAGTTTFNGLVGNTDRLSTLTTNVGGSTVINTSTIKTVTDQTFNDAVKLDSNTTLDSSTSGNITFNNTLDSVSAETNSLLVNTAGTTTFNGLVGNTDRLSTLTTNAGGSTVINTASIMTVTSQTFNDAVKLDTNTTLDSSSSGNITFNSTLDSVASETNALLVNTSGTTTFNGLVGNTDRLSTLTTDAGGSTVINTASIKTVTDQTYNDAVKLDTNTTLDSSSSGHITFNSTLDSVTSETNALLVNTAGTTTFNGLVGNTDRLSTLTTNAGGSTIINTSSVKTVTSQTFNDAVKLDTDTTLDSSSSGNITFNSTLDSVTGEANSLLVNTAGATTFNGLVGNTDRLSTLTTNAGGSTVINTSSVKTVTDQTYNDAVKLDLNTTLDSSTSGNITFNSTLDSIASETNALLVNTAGTTTFNGLVGNADRLSTLTTNAGGSTVINTSSIKTVTDQTYNDAVKLDTNTTLDSSTSGNITFNSTLDSVTSETNSLLVNTAGITTFNGLVGNTDRLSTLTTNAGGSTVINTSSVRTVTDQTYNDAVKLDSNTTLDSSASGNITFNSTLDSASGETNSLLVNTAGTATFNGLVGNTDRLSTLTTNAGGSTVINTSSIKTVTTQTYNDAVKLDTSTTLDSSTNGNITFNSTLDSVTGETNSLVVNTSGTTTFNGLVGNTDRLQTLTTNAGGSTVINTSSVKTVTDQTYNDAVKLDTNTTLDSSSNGNITFNSTLDSVSVETNSLLVNTAGTTTFNGLVGNTDRLSTLTTNAGGSTVINTSSVKTVTNQTYNDAVKLDTNTTLDSSTNGNITFNSTLDSVATETNSLLVNTAGTTTFNGLVGNADRLSTLTTDAGGSTVINTSSIRTVTDQTYNDAVKLDSNTTLDSSANGNITFNSTLDSVATETNSLLVNTAGTTTFNGLVGNTDRLSTLTTNAGGSTVINTSSIKTVTSQTFNDAVKLDTDTTLDSSSSGNITFNSTLDSVAGETNSLLVNTAGTTTFNGLVGNTDRLSTLTTNAGGSTVINTSSIRTVTDQTYNDAVKLDTNTTLDSSTSGNITFNSTLDSVTTETNSLLVNTAGTTTFNGLVGNTDRLSTLTTNAGGSTVINTSSVKTVTNQTYNDAVKLDTNTTLDSSTNGNITFNSSLDSTTGENNSLLVNTSGTTTFNGLVGNTDRLTTLTTNAGGSTVINTSSVKTVTDQTFNDAVKLDTDTTLDSSSSGHVTFNSTLDSVAGETNSLLVNTSGITTFNDLVGNSDRLSTLTTNAGGSTVINTSSIKTVTNQTYNDAVKLDTNTTLDSSTNGNITFNSKLDSVATETNSLLVNTSGTTTFNGLVGNTDRLSTLTTNAGGSTVINTSSVKTVTNQTYNDAVKLDFSTTLDSSSSGNITFNSPLDSATAENNSLLVNTSGVTTFNGLVGSTDRLSTLTTNAGGSTVINTSSVKTVTTQTYNDAVKLNTNTTLDSSSTGNITFNSTLDSVTGETNSLLVNTSGTTTFNGLVGNTDRLSTLTTNAGGSTVINTSSIKTVTDQTYNDAVNLDTNTTLDSSTNGSITFNSTLDSVAGETNSLMVNTSGTTTFNGLVGNTDRLSTLTTNAGGSTVINTSSIKTVTDQTYNDAVKLDTNTTLDSSNNGNITFNSTLDSVAGETNSLLVNTSGTTTFNGLVGNTDRLSTLTTDADGTTVINTSSVKTLTDQVYNDNVVVATTSTLTGVNVTFNGNLDALVAGGQGLTVNASGTTTFGDSASDSVGTTKLQFLTTDSAGTTRINAAHVSTTGDQTYHDSVVIGNSTTLLSQNTTFDQQLDAANAGVQDLTLSSTGNILFTGAVGSNTQLGDIVVTTAVNVTESTGISATSFTQLAGSGQTTFNGAVTTTALTGIQVTSNVITVNAAMTTSGSGVVTFTNAGLLTINGNITSDGAVTQNGAGLVTITEPRSITTTGDTVSFATGVTLSGSGGNLVIDTTVSGNTAGANVSFLSTLHGATAGANAESLTINAGTSGNIAFVGAVDSLGTITITNSNNTTFQNTLQAGTVLISDTTNTVAFQANTTLSTLTTTNLPYNVTFGKTGGPVVTDSITNAVNFLNTGTVTVGLNAGDSVTFQSGMNHTVSQTNITGTLTAISGGVNLGSTALNGTIRTQGQQVTVQALTLTGNGLFDSAFGSATGANVTFGSSVDASTAGVQNLTINTGTAGDILFTGAVGSGTRLGDIVITNAHNVTEQSGIVAASLTQSAGTGTTTLNGATNTNTATGIALTTNVITINNTVTTTGSGGVRLTNAGLLTINANINSDGSVTQDGAGLVTITSPVNDTRLITTTGDAVSFLRAVTEVGSGGQLSIDTTAGGHTAGANVTFSSTLNATNAGTVAERLLINSGTGGDVLFTGAVGGTTRLGSLVITSAHNVTESTGIKAADLTQITGTGLTKLDGVVDTNSATGISLTNGTITVNNVATAINQIALKAINANGNINLNSTIQTTQPTGQVSLTAVHGGVTNGAAVNTINVITNSLVVQTTQGIGSSTAIQTDVSHFAAHNTGTGNIRVDNLGNRLLTIDSVGGVNGITNDGASTGNITITNNGSILVSAIQSATNAPITNSTGGDITLLTKGGSFDITVNSPVTALNGNGNITLNSGHNVVVNDTQVTNDISLTGTGTVSLTAANTVVLGSMDPNTTPDATQHTVANDVVIKTGTGSITNTLPLIYNIQSPQINAAGEVVLSGDFGRPGEHNFVITIYWGDGTSTTQVFADPGHFSFTHKYNGNPNIDDQSAPILINVQVAHDSHVILKALNVNTPTESVPDIGVSSPPPVPNPNINSDLSSAIYNSHDPNYAALHPKVLTATGNVDNPGTVIFQDISVRATAVPVPGEGLASFPYDVTPPVIYLHFPEQIAPLDVLGIAAPPPSQSDTARLDISSGEDGIASQRIVYLEILRADGSVEKQYQLDEKVLDDLMKLISELPDGKYRFQLQEPGESRQRLLLDVFDVRQGKIVDESDDGDRPPSSNNRQQRMLPGPMGEEPADAEEAIRAASQMPVSMARPGSDFDSLSFSDATEVPGQHVAQANPESSNDSGWHGWSSMAARSAWKRAEALTDSFVEQTRDGRTEEWSQVEPAVSESPEAGNQSGTADSEASPAGSVVLVGASIAGLPIPTTVKEKAVRVVSNGLSRAARLFRKFGTKAK